MQLQQVKAIITGGASGLGHAVAQHIVAKGGQVALFDVNEEKGQDAAKALGAQARFFRTDVTSEDGVTANVAAAREAMGGLNVVVNCAGILGAGRVLGKEGPMPLSGRVVDVSPQEPILALRLDIDPALAGIGLGTGHGLWRNRNRCWRRLDHRCRLAGHGRRRSPAR